MYASPESRGVLWGHDRVESNERLGIFQIGGSPAPPRGVMHLLPVPMGYGLGYFLRSVTNQWLASCSHDHPSWSVRRRVWRI